MSDKAETTIETTTGEITITSDTSDDKESIEKQQEAAVAIAEIEADKEIQIAEIEAAVDLARLDVEIENNESETEIWTQILTLMQDQAVAIAGLQTQISFLQELMVAPQANPETISIPPSILTETNETPTEVTQSENPEKINHQVRKTYQLV
jgi:hypothetical protein